MSSQHQHLALAVSNGQRFKLRPRERLVLITIALGEATSVAELPAMCNVHLQKIVPTILSLLRRGVLQFDATDAWLLDPDDQVWVPLRVRECRAARSGAAAPV